MLDSSPVDDVMKTIESMLWSQAYEGNQEISDHFVFDFFLKGTHCHQTLVVYRWRDHIIFKSLTEIEKSWCEKATLEWNEHEIPKFNLASQRCVLAKIRDAWNALHPDLETYIIDATDENDIVCQRLLRFVDKSLR